MQQSLLKRIICPQVLAAALLCTFWTVQIAAQQVVTRAGFQLTVTTTEERMLRQGWRALKAGETDAFLTVIAKLEAQSGANSLLLNEAQLLQARFWLNDYPNEARRSYEEVVAWVTKNKSSIRVSNDFRNRLFEMGRLVYASTNDAYATARLWIGATEWLPRSEHKKAVDIIWEALQNTPYHLIKDKITPDDGNVDVSGTLLNPLLAELNIGPLSGLNSTEPGPPLGGQNSGTTKPLLEFGQSDPGAGLVESKSFEQTEASEPANTGLLGNTLSGGSEYDSEEDFTSQNLSRSRLAELRRLGIDQNDKSKAKKGLTMSTRGWFELASQAYFSLSAGRQYQIWQNWQTKWPDHLAAKNPPSQLKLLPKLLAEQFDRVAVFLPLSGALASVGIAIQEGIIASYFNTPTPYRSSYSFFDTAGGNNLNDLYNQAINEGAEIIVGPLEKKTLAELVRVAKRKVPILGLNYLPGGERRRTSAALYQFGLATTDEQQQIISRALKEAGRRILIVRSSNDWGAKNATLLAAAWRKAGGEVVNEVDIDRPQIAVTRMAGALGINLSNQRARDMRKIFKNKLEFQARHRHDMDAIILVAEPEIARAVKPALAYYFSDNLPVYAYGKSIPTDNFLHPDLSGVRYCDLPWRIHGNEDKDLLEQFRPAAKGISYSFYAFGVDIAGLLTRLNTLKAESNNVLNGATGRLQMNKNRIISREMAWAEIVDGSSVPLDDVHSLTARQEQL